MVRTRIEKKINDFSKTPIDLYGNVLAGAYGTPLASICTDDEPELSIKSFISRALVAYTFYL